MKIMQSVIASTLAMLLLFAVSAADSATAHESAIDAALASPDRPAKDREQDATRKAREVLAFAGVVPGMISGLYQINVRTPSTLTTGDVPITLTVGGVTSPTGTTLPVQ